MFGASPQTVLSIVRDVIRSCSDEVYVNENGNGIASENGDGRFAHEGEEEGDGSRPLVGNVSSAENVNRVDAMVKRLSSSISKRKREMEKRDAGKNC